MTNIPTRLRDAILAGDTLGALALAERHLTGADQEVVRRARHAVEQPEHVAALGRNPASDIQAGISVIKRNFGAAQ